MREVAASERGSRFTPRRRRAQIVYVCTWRTYVRVPVLTRMWARTRMRASARVEF